MKSGNLNFLEPSLTGLLYFYFLNNSPKIWRLRIFENMAMRKLLDLKREKLARPWTQVHTVELQEFLPQSPSHPKLIRSQNNMGKECGIYGREVK